MDIPRTRFIPFRKRDIIAMLLGKDDLNPGQQEQFRHFCDLLQSIFHFEYHQVLETLKDAYAPLNPDRDTLTLTDIADPSPPNFAREMEDLLNRANYEKLSDEALRKAFTENSIFKLRLHIEFDDFEDVLLFTRGEHNKVEESRYFLGLLSEEVEFPNFDRVVIYVKFRDEITTRNLPYKPGATMLKMFQNVPKADIEMLFPNTRVGMRTVDKLIIGVPAIAGAAIALGTKVGASLLLLAALMGYWLGLSTEPVELNRGTALVLLVGLAGLGGFIGKQISNFKNRQLRFLQSLTENLYFKNLDNNAGVYHRLIDDAEEEDCKEAMLAYYFLLNETGLDSDQDLDQAIENWFEQNWNCTIDFEIGDALQKLQRLGLVSNDGSPQAIPLTEACRLLDQRWDNYFTDNQPTP